MSLTPLQVDQTITTTTTTTIELTCLQLLEMVKERLTDSEIPINTVVVELKAADLFYGDVYDFDNEKVIRITYTKSTTSS